MTPQLYDNTVLVSTVPGNASSFYKGNGDGIVWALDAATGKPKWKFNTISDGAKLWGNPKINSGGGLWYPPAVDSQGRVFISVANPAPLYGTKKFPDGSSRPGPNLYTNSLVALDGQTGKLLWFRQTIRHDVRDYDLMIPAILTTVPIKGVQTEIVLVAGKMGKAFAYRADDGKHLWTRSVGKHQNDTGRLPRKPIDIFPGDLGGVETPMALADDRLFVPWVDLATRASASGLAGRQGSSSDTGPRRPDRHRRRHRQGGLAAQAAVDELRRGHGRERRRLHQRLRRHDLRLRHPDRQDALDHEGARRHQLVPRNRRRHAARRRRHGRVHQEAAVRADRLLAPVAHQPKEVFTMRRLTIRSVAHARGGRDHGARARAPRPAHGGPQAHASATTIQVKGGEFSFQLSKKSIAKPGKVTFVFKNIGHVLHDFTINGKKTPLIRPGKTAKLVVTFKKKGKYPYICTVPGHAAAGMKGVFTVR